MMAHCIDWCGQHRRVGCCHASEPTMFLSEANLGRQRLQRPAIGMPSSYTASNTNYYNLHHARK